MAQNVLVILGSGNMGIACAERLGPGRQILLADISEEALAKERANLEDKGMKVETQKVDIVDVNSAKALAARAAELGNIDIVVHTAGLSPSMADAEQIYKVDLLGSAVVIDAFLSVAVANMSMVCIASVAGHFLMGSVDKELEQHIVTAPPDKLLDHAGLSKDHAGMTYGIAKRGNQFQVRAAAKAYAKKGARINSVSPGIIWNNMAKQELASENGGVMKSLLDTVEARYGTSTDVVNAVSFLSSKEASYINGTDLLVDGGVFAASSTS